MIDIEKANAEAVERMMEARPVLVGMGKRASGPLRGAIIGALLFEGLATTEEEAVALMERGEIDLEPCHHHNAVGPMAGVTSPSMTVYIVENKTHGNRAYSNMKGDDCRSPAHGRRGTQSQQSGLDFVVEGAGASSCRCGAGERQTGRSVAVHRRQCAERAQPRDGGMQGDGGCSAWHRGEHVGNVGDSTITETAGIGGYAMAAAPAIVTFVSGTPQDALNATLEMYEITVAEHKYFTIPYLDFRGTPTGTDIRKVVETGITPRVNTGIAHKEAGVGQIGAGLVRPPMEIFGLGIGDWGLGICQRNGKGLSDGEKVYRFRRCSCIA